LLDTLVSSLSEWSNRFVSLGGGGDSYKNSVLNFILIFFLSFLKMPNGGLESDCEDSTSFSCGEGLNGRGRFLRFDGRMFVSLRVLEGWVSKI
jgi:hypothetical protein